MSLNQQFQDLGKLLLGGALGAAVSLGILASDGGAPPAAPAGLVCPENWTRIQVGQLQDTGEDYAACERGDYNLTVSATGIVLYKVRPLADYREITNPTEMARVIERGE